MSAYSDKIIADSPAGYWRLNETSSGVTDSTGGASDGTVNGAVVRGGIGLDGTSYKFPGADTAYALIPIGAYTSLGVGSFTIECWARHSSTPQSLPTIILGNSDGFSSIGFQLRIDTNGANLSARLTSASGKNIENYVPIPGGGINDNKWHHYVWTVTRGTPDVSRVYFDGVQIATANPISGNGQDYTSVTQLYIGRSPAINENFAGDIDEVAIYKIALSQSQITSHYTIGTTPSGGTKMPSMLSPGLIIPLTQNVVYALPPARALLFADSAPTLQQSNDPLFGTSVGVTLTGGQSEVAGGFIRSTGAGTPNVRLVR